MKTESQVRQTRRALFRAKMEQLVDAVEPTTGHLMGEDRLEPNWLRGAIGEAIDVLLSADA